MVSSLKGRSGFATAGGFAADTVGPLSVVMVTRPGREREQTLKGEELKVVFLVVR